MQPFVCPECGEKSEYDPWLGAARCPCCGYTPPPEMRVGRRPSPLNRRRLARLQRWRTLLVTLLLLIIPSLVIVAGVAFLPRLDLGGRAALPTVLAIGAGVAGLFFVPAIVALVLVERRIGRESAQAWHWVAGETGMAFTPGKGMRRVAVGSVSGTYHGRPVRIFARVEGRRLATSVSVGTRQPVAGRVVLLFNTSSTQIGGPTETVAFEQAVSVQSTPESLAETVLADPALRERLLRLRRGSAVYLENDAVTLKQHAAYGIERDAVHLHLTLDVLSDLAAAAEVACGAAPGALRSLAPGLKVLSDEARAVVEEVFAQLEHYVEALEGVEATIVEKDLAYENGEHVLKETRQETRTLGKSQTLDDLVDVRELLSNPTHAFEELPGTGPDEVHIRIMPAGPVAFAAASATGKDVVVTAVFSRLPARLLRMKAAMVNLPLLFRLLLKSQTMDITFGQVRGVPVPTSLHMRVHGRSVGVGNADWSNRIEISYCSD